MVKFVVYQKGPTNFHITIGHPYQSQAPQLTAEAIRDFNEEENSIIIHPGVQQKDNKQTNISQ